MLFQHLLWILLLLNFVFLCRRVCVFIIRILSNSCQGMETLTSLYTLYCEHSLLSKIKGYLTDIICTAVNKVTSGQAIWSTKIKGSMGNMRP